MPRAARAGKPLDESLNRTAAIRAGVLAGLAGLATFLVIHHVWIVPIWFVVPAGVLIAGLGGAAVGATYAELVPSAPRTGWAVVSVFGCAVLVLVPAIVVAELSGPLDAADRDGDGSRAAASIFGLFGGPAIAGASIGWLIGRTRRAVAMATLAALLLAIGPGHDIPFLGGRPVVIKELTILIAVIVVSSVALVVSHGWLAGIAPGGRQSRGRLASLTASRRPGGEVE